MTRVSLLLLLFAVAVPALAQEPAALCTCDAKAGTLEIRYTSDDEAWPKEPKPILLMSLLDIDDDGVHTVVRRTHSKTLRCRLKHDRFEITLRPGVPNRNLQGYCGMAVTGRVNVKRNGVVVINDRWFENIDCFERDTTLDRIVFRDGVAKPEFHYTR